MSSNEQRGYQVADFEFESVLFESPRIPETVELKDTTTDIEIIEDLKSPFLVAYLTIRDDQKFVSGVDVSGGEVITIKIRSTRLDKQIITKRFYIKQIATSGKVNDITEFYIFELIEDVMYESNLQNVNKSYSGRYSDTIAKIAKNYTTREVYTTGNDRQSAKVIIPNMNPIQAMMWLKKKATTIDGYPFYLFATFFDDSIKFIDLGTMLGNGVINPDIPYAYYTSPIQSNNPDVQRRVVYAMEHNNTDDLYTLIKDGAVGTTYSYIDTVKNNTNKFQFDVTKDLLDPIANKLLPKTQRNVMYGQDYVYNGKPFNTLASNEFTRIGGISPYKTIDNDIVGYGERSSIAEYKQEVISNAM